MAFLKAVSSSAHTEIRTRQPPLSTSQVEGQTGWHQLQLTAVCFLLLLVSSPVSGQDPIVPRPPGNLIASDTPLDDGTQIDLVFHLSPDDLPPDSTEEPRILGYVVQRSGEARGLFEEVARVAASEKDFLAGTLKATIEKCVPGEPYWFRVASVDLNGDPAEFVYAPDSILSRQQWFDGKRIWMGILSLIVCLSVVLFVLAARSGMPLKIRPIAGLEAVTEAVGRATEMGRPTLFIPGIMDMNDMQTIAGLTILANVSQKNAEYDTPLEVPTARSLVMTAARENVETSYLVAGRPDAYQADRIYYVSDEQFAYVSYVTGYMVREKPAACFYFGSFFAESLILAETGNSIGAIQVAGTAESHQLPFLVAACDYVLIGEEFFAASAYLSKDPDQLGSLKGQDVGKLIVVLLIVIGSGLFSLANLIGAPLATSWGNYLRDVVLSTG